MSLDSSKKDPDLEKKFATAVRETNLPEIKRLLEHGVSPHYNPYFLLPPSFVAVEENALTTLLLLVEYGAGLLCTDKNRGNLLHEAIEGFEYSYMELYHKGLSEDEIKNNLESHKELSRGLDVTNYLLEKGVSINDKATLTMTPLSLAVASRELLCEYFKEYIHE